MADKSPAEKLADSIREHGSDNTVSQAALEVFLADQQDNNTSTDDSDSASD